MRDMIVGSEGSSPHTRGALVGALSYASATWIIPAYAGSTLKIADGPDIAQDHPRIRGEHESGQAKGASVEGSSPHTRGALHLPYSLAVVPGIIPAYAGSTRPARICGRSSRDHPCIRGEHSPLSLSLARGAGSSPHTRGARGGVLVHLPDAGIIPAYAGSTPQPRSPRWRCRDHPRIRGEHPSTSGQIGGDAGSSPHTRGAHLLQSLRAGDNGIIPAYAGSTTAWSFSLSTRTDHPRIRGEHSIVSGAICTISGSSPHTRGAHAALDVEGLAALDHPRIRGEHPRST